MLPKCLSIAGFDGSGGAGIQADLKTFSALKCYGMTVLTALPVQNTLGVQRCFEIPLDIIEAQLESIFDDIIPDSIKIGMLYKCDIVELVARFLSRKAQKIPVVIDPVMVAKSGDYLLLPDAISAFKKHLLPLATIITPNLPEAHALTDTREDMPTLAKKLLQMGANALLLKGGHLDAPHSNDLYADDKQHIWFESPRLASKNTHGTGCTLSAAIAAFLAQGLPLIEACRQAKHYLFLAIKAAELRSVGKGCGPVHHFHALY